MPAVRLVGSVVLSLADARSRRGTGTSAIRSAATRWRRGARCWRSVPIVFPRYGYPNDLLARLGGGARARRRRAGAAGLRPELALGAASARGWRCRSPGCCCAGSSAACARAGRGARRRAGAGRGRGRRRRGRADMRIGLLTTSFPRHAGDYAGSFVGDRVRRLLADGHTVDVLAAGDGGAAREMEHERLTVTRIASPTLSLRRGAALFYGDGRARGAGAGRRARLAGGGALLRARSPRRPRARAHRFDVDRIALAGSERARRARRRARAPPARVRPLGRRGAARTHPVRAHDRPPPRPRRDATFASSATTLQARFAALAGRAGRHRRAAGRPRASGRRGRASTSRGRRRLGLARPTVLAVGRLVPIKGHDRLLRACARVQRDAVAGAVRSRS